MSARRPERARRQLAGGRRWLFPIAAATVVPLVLLAAIEVGLRAAGAGFATDFLVAVPERPADTPNLRFGWRFFPPAIARAPVAALLPRPKPAASYRIFVLGGSAAMGTPEPAFGFGRILEVLLEERHPGTDFEVVNAAMAAINSHVALEIARDCARREPDMFAVYLGNNEVVGPYGPGTVFGPAAPRLATIRLGLRLRRLRGGQLLARALVALRPAAAAPVRWRGMEMFLDRRVAADDPRLERTYRQLERNLADLAALARRADVPLLLSTVAVNLRDSPPFASLHRPGLGAGELGRWRRQVEEGERAAAAGRLDEAASAYAAALAIDDRHAGLHYRLGQLELRAGEPERAADHLERARDLDALRFRADGQINATIRRVAATAPGRVRLVDAERRLAQAPESRDGLPGRALFWEHVHLRFVGNYRLARAFLAELETLAPAALGETAGPPPSPARVAELLALTAGDRSEMASAIYQMVRRPPFTGQLDHPSRLAEERRSLRLLRRLSEAEAGRSLGIYHQARLRRPDDLHLLERLAVALEESGDRTTAVASWRELVGRLPGNPRWHTRLGFALAAAGEAAEAVAELRRAVELLPEAAEPRTNLASLLEEQGRIADAEAIYREALKIDPASEAARINLAGLLDRRGLAGEAERQLRELIALDPSSAAARRRLGELQDRRGETLAAIDSYRQALAIDPELAAVHNNLGYALAAAGRPQEAAAEYLRALEDDPGYALAYFNLGDLLLAAGRAAEAVAAYEAGLELRPDNAQARRNLGQARELAAAAGR